MSWLKDVRTDPPHVLVEASQPGTLRRGGHPAACSATLPKDKTIEETLDDLGENIVNADKAAIRTAVKRLQRYRASGDTPADLTGYQRRVRANRLLVNDDRLSPQLKGALYGVLLPVAFGSPLTYAGYCAVEECAGVPLHTSLRTALAGSAAADPLTWILARDVKPGARSDKPLDDLRHQRVPVPAAEPLDRVARAVAVRQLRPAHGPILLDFALRYLRRFGDHPGAVLAGHGYLAAVCDYIYRDDQGKQIDQLTRVLSMSFGVPLSRQAIDAVFSQPPTLALYEAVLRVTDRRDYAYVEDQADAAVRRSQGLPNRPMLIRRRRRWWALLAATPEQPRVSGRVSAQPPSPASAHWAASASQPARDRHGAGGRPAVPGRQAGQPRRVRGQRLAAPEGDLRHHRPHPCPVPRGLPHPSAPAAARLGRSTVIPGARAGPC